MFTWICPQCGREVPPSYTECPDCTKKAAEGSAASADPALQAASPGQAATPQVQVRPYTPAPPRASHAGLPTWLMAIVFALAFVGLGAGIYWLLPRHGAAAPPATVESPAAKAGVKVNPLQKYIEIAGVRFSAVKDKPVVKFVVINHSGADITGLAANVTVWGRTQKSEEEAAGTFTFTTNLGPFESKDLSAPLTTKKELV